MTNQRIFCTLAQAVALALALSGCGGETSGDGSTGVIVGPPTATPTPAPAPSPPPPAPAPVPAPSPPPVGLNNLIGAHQFVSLGFGHLQASGPFEDILVPGTIAAERLGFAFSGGRYQVEIPGLPPQTLTPTGQSFANGLPVNSVYSGGNGLTFSLTEPRAIDLQPRLTHSSTAFWSYPGGSSGARTFRGGTFAYGLPTPAGETPTAGRGDYLVTFFGYADHDAGAQGVVPLAGGRSQLTFDFGAGTIEGAITPLVYATTGGTSPVRFELIQTAFVFSASSFSGRFRLPDGTIDGSFEGIFTGPTASEIIVRWQAPSSDLGTGRSGTLFGLWLGKRI